MAINTTKITGSVRKISGEPYEGALVKVYLSSPMKFSDNIVGTEVMSTFTNSYGKFFLDLVPSEEDEESLENYYTFEIIKDTTQIYRKVVPDSDKALDFEDLEDYIHPEQRTLYIVRDPSGKAPDKQIQVDLTGIFKWTTFDGDGTTKEFRAPGEIHIVSLDGLLILEGIDYEKPSFDTVLLDEPPQSGDILAIQYKI